MATPKHAQFVRVPMSLLTTDGVKGTTLATYAALASFADPAGHCFPSVPTIAKRAGVAEKTARAECKRLVRLGYLSIAAHMGEKGGQTSNRYTLLWQQKALAEKADPLVPIDQSPRSKMEREDGGEMDTRSITSSIKSHKTTAAELVASCWSAEGKAQSKAGVISVIATALNNKVPATDLEKALSILNNSGAFVSAYSLTAALQPPKPLFHTIAADKKVDWAKEREEMDKWGF